MTQTARKIRALGLDVGTSRIVVARQAENDFHYSSQLNAFVSVPFSKITQGALEREKVPHSVQAGEIIVHGNESEKFAALLDTEIRRPMTGGVLDAKEPESLNVIRQLLASVLGEREGRDQARVTFTVPAPPLGGEESVTYHEATLRQMLSELGYEAKSINEGLAVVYSELESSNYTGIGISCGGGLCNVCLAYLAVPVISFSVPKAGDFIDLSAAQMTGERANRIRIAKEDTFHFNGHFAEKIHQVISVYYEDMIHSVVAALKGAFAQTSNLPKFSRPIPMVLSGGTAMPPGFRDRFEKILNEQDFPIKISEIRLADKPLFSTAKGALACALTEL